MGCGSSQPVVDEEAKKRNDQIEAQLRQDKQMSKKEIKMLLLGAGESGKSTIVKQMRLNYGYPFDAEEREGFREVVAANSLQSMQTLLSARLELGGAALSRSSEQDAELVQHAEVMDETLTPEVTSAIANLWRDPAIKEIVARSREYQLNDSAPYFFTEITRIGSRAYVPTDEDIIRARVKTTGISEVKFNVSDLIYRVFDVGGQRSERKKWIHCFEGVQCLIFIAALNEYDMSLYEDESTNRIDEASTLFQSVCNSRWFAGSSLVLFLNKTDLFRAKLQISPLSQFMPQYQGDGDWQSASAFMLSHFTALLQNPNKRLYSHFTCATDKEQTKFVLSALQDFLIHKNLERTGLI